MGAQVASSPLWEEVARVVIDNATAARHFILQLIANL
jgi:hypothetical protein